jgi:hypothetical protein
MRPDADRDPVQIQHPASHDRGPAGCQAILSYRVEYLLVRQAKNREDFFHDPVREVRVRGETCIKAMTRERRDAIIFPSNGANEPYCTYREAIPTLSPLAQRL